MDVPTSTTSSSSTPTLPSSSTSFLSATVTAAAEVKNPYSKKNNRRYNKTNKSFLLVLFLSIITILLSSCFIVLLVHAYQLQSSSSLSSSSSNEDLSSSSILNANDNDGMKSTQQDSAGNDNSDTNNHSSQNISSNIRKNLKTSEESNTNNSNQNINNEKPPIIAYAISLTSCSQTPSLVDGAAILAHSIHLNSIRNTNTHDKKPPSKYDYKLYAFFHTSVITETSTTTTSSLSSSSKEQYTQTDIQNNKCASILSKLGYEIKVVDIPVPLSEIQGEYLKTKLPSNGCCGEKEFIKLWSYTLVEHPFVVHLDLDTIVLKPMDELFDYALHGTVSSSLTTTTTIGNGNSDVVGDESEEERKKGVIMWKKEERYTMMDENWSNINAFFTRDYNMRPAGKKPVGVQGGFLINRPSMEVFSQFQSIIRSGNFTPHKGWGDKGYQFYGAMTFQGIIPYFYDIIQPNTSIELNRCMYNVMADNPRDKRTVNNIVSGNCRDGRKDCEDCRERNIEDVRTAHFTLCQKPWECLSHNHDMLQHRLCRKLFGEWYKVRADLELSWVGKSFVEEEEEKKVGSTTSGSVVVGNGGFEKEHFRGFCNGYGKKGYIPMELHDER